MTRDLQSLLVPTFTDTIGALVAMITAGTLWGPLLISNQALVLGYLSAVIVGVSIGFGAARSRRFERAINPYLDVILIVPQAAMMPIYAMALGFGLTTRSVVVFAFAVVLIALNTRAGVRNVDARLVEMARAFGAKEAQIWRQILLPGALPGIMAGLRLGLARALLGMVVVEMLLVAVGVGALLLEFRGRFAADHTWAVVLVVILQASILVSLAGYVERRMTRWQER